MKLTSIPYLYRNVKRWTEILTILSRYGLADWISRLNVDFVMDRLRDRHGDSLARHSQEVRIRMALTDLGPTFIKLGQLLSTRPDVVGGKLADELKQLQTAVPADPPETVRATLLEELGQPVDELFTHFEEVPIASASIGQVHRARLPTGEPVAIKVQHHDIERTVREDLEVLAGLAQLAERLPELAAYRPSATVAELARMLRRELDFGREERNLQQFATLFANDPHVRIPRPYSELCTPRVLAMEWIDGVRLSDAGQLAAAGFEPETIARRGAAIYLAMIFKHGFFHADPHPGNLVLMPGNVIGLLDFGMVGRIDDRLRSDIEHMLMAIVQQDVGLLTSVIKRVGSAPPTLDETSLANDLADFVGHYATQGLDQFDMSGALNDIVEIIHRHRITLPSQAALLIKTLVTLEGTTKVLSPSFSVMEVLQPLHRQLLLRRLSPRQQWRRMRRLYFELQQLAEILPSRVMNILEQVQAGKFDVHLDHRGLGPSVNRLVLGMLASALFLGSSVMLSQQVPPLLFPETSFWGLHKLSLLGVSGCSVSVLLGLRLLRAIGKSGHLDQRE